MGGGIGRARVSPAPLCPQNPGGGSGEGECWGLSIPPGAAPGGGGGRRARGRGTPGDAQSRGVSGGGVVSEGFGSVGHWGRALRGHWVVLEPRRSSSPEVQRAPAWC